MIVDHTQIGAAFRRLSIPVAVQMLGDQLLGMADTIAIGSLGAVALAGATAANTIFIVVTFAAFGFMSGTSIVAAQRIGARRHRGFRPHGPRGCRRRRLLVGVLCLCAQPVRRAARRCTR